MNRRRSGSKQHRPARWKAILGLLGLLVLSISLTVPDQRAFAQGGVSQLRQLPTAMTSVGHLDLDASARRLFEIGDAPEGGMKVVAYDLDSFAPMSSTIIPGSSSGYGGKLSVVDEEQHRLYLLYPEGLPGAPKTVLSIAVIDTMTNQVLAQKPLAEAPASPSDRSSSNDLGFKALSFYRPASGTPKLYLVSEVPTGQGDFSGSNHSLMVTEVDAARIGTSDPSIVNWRYQLPQCAMAMSRESPSVVYRTRAGGSLFVPCRAGGMPGLFTQPLETPGIVELEISEGLSPSDTSRFASDFYPISGNLQWGMAAVDRVSERMVLHVDGSTTESAVWMFDMATKSWLGASVLPKGYASGATTGVAIDETLGRMYVASSVGIEPFPHIKVVLAATRASGAEQGRVLLAPTDANVGRSKVVVDSQRHRFFLGTGEGFAVFEDSVPADVIPAAVDPDSNTTELPDGAGVGVNFSSGGQAYGSRIRWVRGVRGVERNVNTIVDGIGYPPQPAQGTREFHFARVIGATMNNGEATAKGTSAERDLDNTDNDTIWMTTLLKDHTDVDMTQQRWPYATVDCTDFGGTQDKVSDSANGANVTCSKTGSKVTALTFSQAISAPEQVSIGHSLSNATLIKDPVRGVVSKAEAEVGGIVIAGKVGIGRIHSLAESWAAGRRGTANSNFVRTIQDVWYVDDAGQRQSLCGALCDPELVRVTLNRVLGVRARVDLPQPDPDQRGTPGGYEALVVRDQFERMNERSVNEEADSKRLEVPALVLTLFADGRSPSRVVFSFAAVASESHFGIYGPGKDGGFDLPREIIETIGSLGESFGSDDTSASSGSLPKRAAGAISKLVTKTLAGFKFFLASPGHAARAGALWLFLAAPLLLWMRRSALSG